MAKIKYDLKDKKRQGIRDMKYLMRWQMSS